MNILFIMADQLRWDHLGCSGHPYLKTPNIDALAARGVRFSNAFVNSGVCGPSRMSFYTGRYPVSHGATWNRVPLSVGEVTLGESVDLVPTVLDALGVEAPTHRLEGRSLQPLLHGSAHVPWRDFVYSELDYAYREARLLLGKDVHECRAFSLRDERWRYVYWVGEREQLFDLRADPQEFVDLGAEPGSESTRQAMQQRLLDFLARRRHRSTVTDAEVERGTAAHKRAGVFFGQW